MANNKTDEQARSADGKFGTKPTAVKDAEKFVKEALDNLDIPTPEGRFPDEPDDEDPWYGDPGYSPYRSRGKRRKGKSMSRKHAGMSALFWIVVIVVALAMVH